MSSVEYLREFVNERLSAAAEEIFRVFRQTIFEFEEEIDRQRKLLDIVWKPEIKLHRTELPQQHVCKEEEVLSAHQLCIQERNSSLDQGDSGPPQIKVEKEELCISQEGEQLEVKQETETFMLIPTDEESDHSEGQTLDFNPDNSQSVTETELPAGLCISLLKEESDGENLELSEPNSDHQLLSHNFHVAENQDQNEGKHGRSGSTNNTEPKPQNRNHNCTSHSDDIYNPAMSMIHFNAHTDERPFKCDTCEKTFKRNSDWRNHLRVHTGEKPYSCHTCGKRFNQKSLLTSHMRIHSGERPYSCKICEKDFRCSSHLRIHMRIHTGEKPYSCNTCGKRFNQKSALTSHIRIHTGEKPFTCITCGREFRYISHLRIHTRIHTGEKPCSCKICGRDFRSRSSLMGHIRTHTGEKPYFCKTCGKDFSRNSHLLVHIRRAHTGEKPYLCKICGKSYFDSSHLAKHKRSHSST